MAQVTLEFIDSIKKGDAMTAPEQRLGPPETKAQTGANSKAGLGESKFKKGKK